MLTQEEFKALDKGRQIVDGDKRIWEVQFASPVAQGSSDVPGEFEVILKNPTGDEVTVGWAAGRDPGICDDEHEPVRELNHPKAYLKPE